MSREMDNITRPVTSSASKLFDLPAEIFRKILLYIVRGDVLRLSRTCKAIYGSDIVLEALYAEPFARQDVPDPESPMHRQTQVCLTFLRRYEGFCTSLDEVKGPLVKHLIISNLIPMTYPLSFIKHCTNVRCLDLTILGYSIDRREFDALCVSPYIHERIFARPYCDKEEHKAWFSIGGHNAGFKLRLRRDKYNKHAGKLSVNTASGANSRPFPGCPWRTSTKCLGWDHLLAHGRHILQPLKTVILQPCGRWELRSWGEYWAPISFEDDIIRERRQWANQRFVSLLSSIDALHTLELQCNRALYVEDGMIEAWVNPAAHLNLQTSIIDNVGHTLRSLRLTSMHRIIRNLALFLRPLETLPNLNTITISIERDIESLDRQWRKFLFPIHEAKDGTPEEVEVQEHTIETVLDYLTALHEVASSGRWNVRVLNSHECPLRPRALFSLLEGEGFQILEWLCDSFQWSPVFTWLGFDSFPLMIGERLDRELVRSGVNDATRINHLASCRKLFEILKAKDLTRKLNFFSWALGSTFFGMKSRHISSQLYLDCIGDLIDELQVNYGEEVPPGCPDCYCGEYEKEREEGLYWEAVNMQAFWESLATIFPNLLRFEVFIPARLYPATDEAFVSTVLPGLGWTVHCGKDRTGYMEQYFNRVFTRKEVDNEEGCERERPPYACLIFDGDRSRCRPATEGKLSPT